LVWHPTKYAELLADKIRKHGAHTWLVNTGWSGGAFGVGKRMKLSYTRAIVDAIHSGSLQGAETVQDEIFGVQVPTSCEGVPSEILIPKNTWADGAAYDETARKLAKLFADNFQAFADVASDEIRSAGPRL
jgi:phosphoenolpyruvate carboxykinase (ATP)